jgi:hypothetical protein
MKLFSWGEDEKTAAEISGTPAPIPGSPADAARVDAAAAANVLLQTPARGRGRPRKNPPTGGGNSGDVSPELAAEIQRQLDATVYAPEQWGALLALPGDAAHAFTGREYWEVSKEERKTLGVCGSAVARTMMIQNPRTLAIVMLGSALLSVYLPRAMQEMKHLQGEKKKASEPNAPKT